MPGQKSKHAERDVLRMKDSQRLANQVGVLLLPSVVQNAGINAQANTVAMFLASSRGADAFVKSRRADFIHLDHALRVQAPGDHRLGVWL